MNDSKIIVALDGMTTNGAINFCKEHLDPKTCRVKVGKELFTLGGPPLIQVLSDYDFEVFLDLKFHDIPNTVAKAVTAAAELGVWMVNVHASGGSSMMQKAKESLIPYGNEAPLLIAVTVLTSMKESDLKELGINYSPAEQVARLARLAYESGLDGVVSSALEASNTRRLYGNDFKIITPGIRPVGSNSDDQERIMTPSKAIAAGSDYLVIGRPITQAENPQEVLRQINESIG